METTVVCTFEQRLTTGDVGKLARMIGAVIPIPTRHHLIGSAQVGLDSIINGKSRDYARLRSLMRDMTLTVLRKVEGNQMVLGIPVHGQVYTIKNTGPVLWEKGDVLTTLPPIPSGATLGPSSTLTTGPSALGDDGALISAGGWRLVLPWMVPMPLATEINQRLLTIALLSLDRSREEVRAATTQLRTVRYRDSTIVLPDPTIDDTTLTDLRNVCISLSMIANLSSEVILTYVRKLALEDSSMLLMKCQEILNHRQQRQHQQHQPQGSASGPAAATSHRPDEDSLVPRHGVGTSLTMTPTEELNKLTALLVMIRQVTDVIAEQPTFLVCDLSPDDRSAVCIYKG